MIMMKGFLVKTSKYFFIGFILFVLVWVLYLFKPFLLTIAIGILMAVSTASLERRILALTNAKRVLSASLITLFICIFFLAPFLYAIISLAKYASGFDMTNVTNTLNYIKNYDFSLPESFSFLEPKIKEFIATLDIGTLISKALGYLSTIGKSSAGFIVDMGFIIVFYFFANLYGAELTTYLKKVVPMNSDELDFILTEVANTMSVVVYSTLANAVLQGMLFAILVSFFGYDMLLMGILFAIGSLIPLVGGALVYVPIALFELAHGNTQGSIIILSYSIIVISVVADTFVKPLIIKFINEKMVKTPTKINEMLIFFSMLAGISTFGFWGVILGPAIVTFFISTIKLYVLLKERAIV
ncbi:acid membrane antigen A [Campylobacter geochelonis]|nr:acid membrane antigen A [Campylobacter geochelonis]